MPLRLTSRDLDLFRWINAMGFVTLDHVAQYWNVHSTTAHKRLKKHLEHEFLNQERLTYDHAIYYLTRRGVDISDSVLPPLRQISLSSYRHDLFVVSLSLQLMKHYGGQFISERELRQRQGMQVFGGHTHISDGDFLYQEKRFAIEVELNKKSEHRREKIFHHYQKQFEYDAVWYFCGNQEVKNQLIPYAEKVDWLKLYDLNAFLQEGTLSEYS